MSCPHCQKRKAAEAAAKKAGACCGGAPKEPSREALSLWIAFASLLASFLIACFDLSFPAYPLSDPAWIAVGLCGLPILRAACEALFRRKQITSSLLISVGILASIGLQFFVGCGADSSGAHTHDSYIFAAGEIAFLMALGQMLENRTLRKTREGIEALVRISPKQALRVDAGGATESVPVEALNPGDCIVVCPDEVIPADGTVVAGASAVNQASLTGESVPADKFVGDAVLAGTHNLHGVLTVRVSKRSGDTAIARLIRLVEDAEAKKAPIQHVADRWASKIVPAAILCSLLVFIFSFAFLKVGAEAALIRGVTILVVFCPCAFALATPTAIAAGIGNAARRGVLVKSGAALERLAEIDTAVFDKTGTLTRAELRVEAIFSAGALSEQAILELCAAAEQPSRHPIARAIIARCGKTERPVAEDFKTQNGVGIVCRVGGQQVELSSRRGLRHALPEAAAHFADSRAAFGESLVFLSVDGVLAGIVALSDTLRENAVEMLAGLKRAGIRSVMLTGDNAAAGRSVAERIGVDECVAELLPEGKASYVKKLRDGGARGVLMVGDGVNDAPAFAVADCSVAMGALGSELAVETAEIALLNDRIELVPALVKFSKTVLRTIHTNFALSIAVNAASVVLSAAGILDPVSGALVHNASSLLVVMNSASLLTRKFNGK